MSCCNGSNDAVSLNASTNNKRNNVSDNVKFSNNPTANKLHPVPNNHETNMNSTRSSVGRRASNENVATPALASSTHSKKNQPKYLGVNLTFLFEFVKNCGGYEKLRNKTTEEVVNEFIIPQSQWKELSLCQQEYKGSKYPNMISDQVTWFICNPRKHNFIQVVKILANTFSLEWNPETGAVIYFSGQSKNIYFYFDIFSQSQHLTVKQKNEIVLSKKLMDDVQSIGKFLLILTSWESAEFLQRTWCLYEIYMSYETKCEFKIAVSYEESAKFNAFVVDGASLLLKTLATKSIKSQLSQTSTPNTFTMIENVIKQKLAGGFPELDRIVYSVINYWFKDYLQQKIVMSQNNEDECATWKFSLANIYYNERNFDEAIPLFQDAFEVHHKNLSYGHPYVLSELLGLADIYDQQGEQMEECEKLYSQALEIQKNIKPPGDSDVIESMVRLANKYRQSDKYDEASKLYVELLELRTTILGNEHEDVLSTLNILAEVYKAQQKFDETEALYKHAIEGYKHKGGVCVHKLSIMNNLGSLYKLRGKLDQAEALFLEVLETRMKYLGAENANTLISMHNLASLYNAQKRYAEAEELYIKCLEIRRRVLGNDNSSTVTSIHSLGMFLQDRGRPDEAAPLLAEAKSRKFLLSSSRNSSSRNSSSRKRGSTMGSSRRLSLKL